MKIDNQLVEQMADLVFTLRQKCAAKDLYFVKNMNITTAEFNCLTHFFNVESLSVKELAEKLGITSGGVTRIITSLEKKGIIKRTISPFDRRSINVSLTGKGKRIIQKIKETSIEIHHDILSKIGVEHREAVLEAIEKLVGAIDQWLVSHNGVHKEKVKE